MFVITVLISTPHWTESYYRHTVIPVQRRTRYNRRRSTLEEGLVSTLHWTVYNGPASRFVSVHRAGYRGDGGTVEAPIF